MPHRPALPPRSAKTSDLVILRDTDFTTTVMKLIIAFRAECHLLSRGLNQLAVCREPHAILARGFTHDHETRYFSWRSLVTYFVVNKGTSDLIESLWLCHDGN